MKRKSNMFDLHGKITLAMWAYAFLGFAFGAAEQTFNYLDGLPPPTLTAIGLGVTLIGGIASYFWEQSRNPKADIRKNVPFALCAGLIIGLGTYQTVVIEWHNTGFWLMILTAVGFSNQVVLKAVAWGTGKTVRQYFEARRTQDAYDFSVRRKADIEDEVDNGDEDGFAGTE